MVAQETEGEFIPLSSFKRYQNNEQQASDLESAAFQVMPGINTKSPGLVVLTLPFNADFTVLYISPSLPLPTPVNAIDFKPSLFQAGKCAS